MARLFAPALAITLAISASLATATDVSINRRADGVWLTFSNLPPQWSIQSSNDLTNWFTQVSGTVRTNGYVEFILRPDGGAQFWRVLPVTSSRP